MPKKSKPVESNIEVWNIERLYKALKPNVTTIDRGIVYFNSTSEKYDNAYFNEIQDCLIKSAVHSNFIALRSNLLYGSGLYPLDPNDTALIEFLKRPNKVGDVLDDIYKKQCFDYSNFSAISTEVIWNAGGQLDQILNVNPAKIRAEQPDCYGNVSNYYVSDTWGYVSNRQDKRKVNDVANAKKIAAYNPISYSADCRQLMYTKQYTATNEVYASPSWTSALNWINLEFFLSDYLANKLLSGYHIAGFLHIPSSMTKEQQDEWVLNFKRKYSSSSNSGKIVFNFTDPSAQKPEFVPIQDDLGNSMFKDLIQQCQQSISIAHGGSTSLLGIDQGGNIGNNNADASKINTARLFFIDSVIKPGQNVLLNAINKLLAINGLGKVGVHNEPLKLTQPIADKDDLVVGERRTVLYGLPFAKPTEPIQPNNPITVPAK